MERDRLAGRVIALHPGSGLLSTRCGRVLRFSRAELLLSTFDSEIQAGSPVSFEVEPSHGMQSAVRVSRATAFEFEVGRRFITRYHDAPLGDPDLLPVSSSLCRLVSRTNDSRAAAEHELENLVRRAGGNLLIHCSEQRLTHGVQVSATAGLYLQRFAAAMDTRTFVSWGIRNGVFDSQFISLESLDTSAFEPEAGNEAVLETLALCPDHQTQALIPAIYKAIESLEPNAPVVLGGEADFTCGAILIGVGKPYLMPWHLESDAVTHLLLIPHITDRGPNCIWILSRGPEFQGHQETYREITFF